MRWHLNKTNKTKRDIKQYMYIFSFSFQELIRIVIQHKAQLIRKDQYVKDLESYIDSLLVRVMEATPRILQNGTRFK